MQDWWPQRRFTRQQIALPLLHRPKDATGARAGAGWTCDLSAAGARIEVAEHFEPLKIIYVYLQTDYGSIEGEARVIWAVDGPPREGGIRHGVAFTHLAPDHCQVLQELLSSLKPWLVARGRLPLNLPVTCRPLRQPRPPLQGRTGNFSRGGVLLCLPKALTPPTALELTLCRPTETLTLTGIVVWAEPVGRQGQGGLIAHGLRFTSLDWITSLALARFLVGPEEGPHRSI